MKYVSQQIERDKLGRPGIRHRLVIAPENIRPWNTGGSEREFKLCCSLAKQVSYSSDEVKASLTEKDGESFFLMPGKADRYLKTTFGTYTLQSNIKGELARISFICQARDVNQAYNIFYLGISSYLDYLAFIANCPLVIDSVSCEDTSNDINYIDYVSPYPQVDVDMRGERRFLKQLEPIYALYREAKNNTSDFYRFLCFYKILEGIYKNLRPALIQKAKAQSITLEIRSEKVPTFNDNEIVLPEYKALVGKGIQYVFDKKLTANYRIAIAHFSEEKSKTVLDVNDYLQNSKFSGVIHLCEVCCREAITIIEFYYQQFFANGGDL